MTYLSDFYSFLFLEMDIPEFACPSYESAGRSVVDDEIGLWFGGQSLENKTRYWESYYKHIKGKAGYYNSILKGLERDFGK